MVKRKKIYKAYNIMFYKGKPIAKSFVHMTGTNKEKLRVAAKKENRRWNKMKGSKGYKAKLVKVV